ncbi:hypothetical protein PILCRDRAFT_821546, partial [Piloderma croceum F 1598]
MAVMSRDAALGFHKRILIQHWCVGSPLETFRSNSTSAVMEEFTGPSEQRCQSKLIVSILALIQKFKDLHLCACQRIEQRMLPYTEMET